jgi:hypothetical protein
MTQNKKHITPENITEWLASTGFLLPRNAIELERFEKLYGEIEYGLTGKEIDPDKIINNDFREKKNARIPDLFIGKDINQYRMVARNGKDLPKHIMDKIIKNQNKQKNDSSSSEGTDQ